MIKLTVGEKKAESRFKKYEDIIKSQAFRGRAISGPHAGELGTYLKAAADQGGVKVRGSILYRLDHSYSGNLFEMFVGAATDFEEYEPLDLELVVTLAEK